MEGGREGERDGDMEEGAQTHTHTHTHTHRERSRAGEVQGTNL